MATIINNHNMTNNYTTKNKNGIHIVIYCTLPTFFVSNILNNLIHNDNK